MGYQVTCGCGKAVAVRSGDAGATVRCGCGQNVEVPSLHRLRLSAGEEALPPVVRIRAMLVAGALPGTRTCAGCGREPAANAPVFVECERVRVEEAGSSKAELAAGCLLWILFGWIVAIIASTHSGPSSREYGEDILLRVPLPVCPACRPAVSNHTALAQALRTVPDYADLLDRYPAARFALQPGDYI